MALLGTASISTLFCFANIYRGVTLLCQAGYMLGSATHLYFNHNNLQITGEKQQINSYWDGQQSLLG